LQRGKAAVPTSPSKRPRRKVSFVSEEDIARTDRHSGRSASPAKRPQSTSPRRTGRPETVAPSVLRGDSSASMGGIGIALEEAADAHYGVRICGISPFSVAALSGRLALHDRIVAVNGVSCEGLSAFQVVSLLRDGAGPLLHVRVRPLLSNHASSEHVAWVLRVRADGPSDIPTLERYANSGSVGAVISEGDNEALWHVDHIKIGGAAWLAAEHASMQSTIHGETHVTLMEGDCIETVNGRSVRDTDAPAVLRGPWFTRIRLGVLRNGIPLAVDMVRSPVMEREHLRHALVYLSSLRQAFSMQHGNTDSWRPALPTDASQHAHTSPNHACREQDAAPNVTRVQAVAKMIHADLDKVLASLSSPSLRSSAGISERDEQSPGLASREVALDRVRAVLGTADAFKLKHTASHKHARLQSQTVNGQPTSLSSPAASRQETLLQEETSLDAPRVRVASRAGNPDTMPPAALQPYPLQHHAADPRFYGNVHDNGMRGEKEHLYGLAVQARKELERINAEHDRREHQQEGARQRVLNAMHEENEQLYGQMTQARRELERINTEYDRRMHEQEGEKQMNDRKAESIWPSVIQPAGFLVLERRSPETMDGEERAEMRRDVHKLAQNVSPSLIQPFAFLAPSKRDDENVHAVHDGRAPLLSVQERGGKMHLEQALRSAEDAQKGTSFATGKSAYGHEFDIICQREQAVRAALGYVSRFVCPLSFSSTAHRHVQQV